MSGDRASTTLEPPAAAARSELPAAPAAPLVNPVSNSAAGNVGNGNDAGSESATQASSTPDPNWRSGRYLWQVPTILLSTVLIAWGLIITVKPAIPLNLDTLLDQVEGFLAAGQIKEAGEHLRTVPESAVADAIESIRGRFHANLGDYLFAFKHGEPDAKPGDMRAIADQYQLATDVTWPLSPAQHERWALALLASGDVDGARTRLVEIDKKRSAAEGAIAAEFGEIRNRLFRRIVERTIFSIEQSSDDLLKLLADYRLDRSISTGDEIWAIARQTELRLRSQQPRQAIDLLMVEMRRLESRDLATYATDIGELYTLLGRGYFDLGEYDNAKGHLEHALSLINPEAPVRGAALVLIGQIELSTGAVDEALERFQIVISEFIATPAYLQSLLGSAEAQSIIGKHAEALADYRELCRLLPQHSQNNGIDSFRVSGSLCDRHDAALALGRLETALGYIGLAESLFNPSQVPSDVLIRQASTNRQYADDLIAQGQKNATTNETDVSIRREANYRYHTAGEYYLRHFNADTAMSAVRDDATNSLWLAADCFDLGGRQDLSIANFTKYLDMQPMEDPRRPETLFRLAQAYQAITDHENAAKSYEQVVADRSRSAFAARSYVPLAQSYLALDRVPEARQLLSQVVSGSRLLTPEASAYRDALVELGRIEYHNNQFAAAIKALTEFVERYPDDARSFEARYLLGDSYRANALSILDAISKDASLAPTESSRLHAIAVEQLQTALGFFAMASEIEIPEGTDAQHAYHRDVVRRAALYRADCAYHLGRYEQAIDLYDRAARRYGGHQSSMYALIQIVNSYNALGDSDRAAAAHHRALVRLKQLDDAAFASPDSLMDRSAWERWLQNVPVGPAATGTAQATSG